MTRHEFTEKLREGLTGLPQSDIEERAAFFSEMIDDLMEDGMSEEEAVAHIGPVEEVIRQIVSETPLSKLVRERVRARRKPGALMIILLVLGSPVWISVLLVILAAVLCVYITLWSLVIALWACDLAIFVTGAASIVSGIFTAVQGQAVQGAAITGAGIALIGLSVFAGFVCFYAGRLAVLITAKSAVLIKSMFVRKGNKQ